MRKKSIFLAFLFESFIARRKRRKIKSEKDVRRYRVKSGESMTISVRQRTINKD